MNRKYTQEHIDFIATNIQGCPFKDLTDKFNERFGMDLRVSAMISLSDRHGLHNGRDTRLNKGYTPTQFKKGHAPWNKNLKGQGGWEPTQFKTGRWPSAGWAGVERIPGGGQAMKGRRPTKKQKEIITQWHLSPQNWLVTRNLLHQGELHIRSRSTGRERVLRDI